MKKDANILIVDDDREILSTFRILLGARFTGVDICDTPGRIDNLLENNDYDLVLLDMNFNAGRNTGNEGLYWLERIINKRADLVVVMITAYGDIDQAVRCMKRGAFDYILKPWENERLITTVSSGVELSRSRQKYNELSEKHKSLLKDGLTGHPLIGSSHSFAEVMKLAEKAAPSDANILLLGENGTGKSMLAKHIHAISGRKNGPFISVDLGALSSSLIEGELFGYRKGAFTGAVSDYAGRLYMADGGTLFLDEIGNLTPGLQIKFLRVIQDKVITPLGDNRTKNIDVRFISATNRTLLNQAGENSFREDLLYRIKTIELTLPPLRERVSDIALLAGHFLELYTKKYNKSGMTLHSGAIDHMLSYNWPGNIRELEHTIEKAVIMADQNLIRKDDLGLRQSSEKFWTDHPVTMSEIESGYIEKAMQRHNGNISLVAKELGLSRPAIYRKIKKYGL